MILKNYTSFVGKRKLAVVTRGSAGHGMSRLPNAIPTIAVI